MTTLAALFFAACFLAYANGANDNFKGVATLFGSKTADYRCALVWATLCTAAGSGVSVLLARSLLKSFSGQGMVPDAVAGSPEFLLAVALGAGLTVLLAAIKGFPISTTHALTGALTGAAFAAAGSRVNLAALGGKFFLPLLVSPLLALVMGSAAYAALRLLRRGLGVRKEWCVCIGETLRPIPALATGPALTLALGSLRVVEPALDSRENCVERYAGRFIGVPCQSLVDSAHWMSAGLVSFARGLNDTPKIVALLAGTQALDFQWGAAATGAAMALGGLFGARKVAETMSLKITPLNSGQGFSANLVTSLLVIFASRFGVPVSTTHVSVGALFGIAALTGSGDKSTAAGIALSWVLTLPLAALLAAGAFVFLP